jgi:hypothetical protein
MVRYELLKSTNITPLVASGIISINVATWINIYEYYLHELKGNQKVNAIQFAADYYRISTPTIYRIISFMEN